MGLSGRRSISHRVSPSRGPFFLAPLLPGAKSSGFLPSETSLIFLNCILKSCLMRLDQLKESWLAERTRKTKKKKVLNRISFKAVTKSSRLASHTGLTLWIQHGDWGGAGGGRCFVYFSREPKFQP